MISDVQCNKPCLHVMDTVPCGSPVSHGGGIPPDYWGGEKGNGHEIIKSNTCSNYHDFFNNDNKALIFI